MTEDKVVWEKPPGCRLEFERGQRGAYGYKIRINDDDFNKAFLELQKAVGILENYEKDLRENRWKLEDKNGK